MQTRIRSLPETETYFRGEVAKPVTREGVHVVEEGSRWREDGEITGPAEAFVALTTGAEPGARCAFFANNTFRSEGGHYLADQLTAALRTVLPAVDEPIGRTYRLLRETRMAAVVCELVPSALAIEAKLRPEALASEKST